MIRRPGRLRSTGRTSVIGASHMPQTDVRWTRSMEARPALPFRQGRPLEKGPHPKKIIMKRWLRRVAPSRPSALYLSAQHHPFAVRVRPGSP